MSRIPILILLLGFLAMSVTSSPNGLRKDWRRNLAFTPTSQQNQQGEFLKIRRLNREASHLPEKYKVHMKRHVPEENAIQHYPCYELKEEVPATGISSYELVPGIGYYKFYPEGAMSYDQALGTCMVDGGYLAIINSEAEMLALKSIYEKYSDADDYAWLGFYDYGNERKFETVFGVPLEDTGYVKWDINQPESEEKGEECGAMDREGKLHDLYCEENAPWPFFCEIELDEDQELEE